ncbi:MAG: hypothetical protein Q4A05_11235 [Ruminococcus sp.]|nr:hypothetical protein [Ruminococcus sp.]
MKRLRFAPLLLAAGLLTGCASDGSVSNKSYLRAAVIGRDSVTLAFFSEEDEVVTVAADSPEAARTAAELAGGHSIFTGYTELIILDGCDSAATLDFMLNEWRVSPSCIVACPVGDGAALLADRGADELEGAVKVAQSQELIGRCDIVTVLGGLLGDGKAAEVPALSREGFVGTSEIRDQW